MRWLGEGGMRERRSFCVEGVLEGGTRAKCDGDGSRMGKHIFNVIFEPKNHIIATLYIRKTSIFQNHRHRPTPSHMEFSDVRPKSRFSWFSLTQPPNAAMSAADVADESQDKVSH